MRAFALRPAALGCMAATLMVSGMACTGVIGDATTSGSGGTAGNTGTTGTGSTSGTGTGGSATGTGSTTGTGGGGTGTGATTGNGFAAACAASKGVLNAGLTPARRLTRDEYNNTVRDLLGATGTPADGLGQDEKIGPFNSNAIAPIDELQVQQSSEVAGALAIAAQAKMATISPCDLATDTTTSCATKFVTAFGQKAYRRPLTHGRDHPVRQSLHAGQGRHRRRSERVSPRRRGDAAVAVLPLSPGRGSHRDAAGGHRGADALRARVAPLVLPVGNDAGRCAVRARRGRHADAGGDDLRAGSAHAERRQGAQHDRIVPPPVARSDGSAEPAQGRDRLPDVQRLRSPTR